MAEKHYTFIKNGRVENTLVFAERNDELDQAVATDHGYDSFVWLDENPIPHRYSSYNGTAFTEPDADYLYSIGVNNMNQAMLDKAKAAAETATPLA